MLLCSALTERASVMQLEVWLDTEQVKLQLACMRDCTAEMGMR